MNKIFSACDKKHIKEMARAHFKGSLGIYLNQNLKVKCESATGRAMREHSRQTERECTVPGTGKDLGSRAGPGSAQSDGSGGWEG